MRVHVSRLSGRLRRAIRQGGDVDVSEYPFKIKDLDGYVFTVADSTIDRWFPEEGSSEIGNAVIRRVETVEKLFNCTIERIDYDDEEANRAAMTGSKYADIIIAPTFSIGRWLLKSKALVDINTLEGLNLEAEYWTRWGDTSIMILTRNNCT